MNADRTGRTGLPGGRHGSQTMSLAKRVKQIRRRCQEHSQNRNGLGISELFLAPPKDAEFILAAQSYALKTYLLGY